MLDQVSELRELVQSKGTERESVESHENRRSGELGRVISVTSGKGGVGKTNTAVNLSIQLARRDKRVILLDMDLGLANVDIMLDIHPRYNLTHLAKNEASLEQGLVRGPGGVHVLAGASGAGDLADLDPDTRKSLLNTLLKVQKMADLIVVDTGAGISKNVIPFAASADEVITVTTPEPTAMMDAYAAIKKLSAQPNCGNIRVVVNMANDRNEALETAKGVENAAGRFLDIYVEKLGFVLRDEAVQQAVRQKTPVSIQHPNADAAQCYKTIADILMGKDEEGPERTESSFIKNVVSWLMPK